MESQPRETDRVSAVRAGAPSPVVVMGVTGSGKSTVGSALAQRLRVPFVDGDTLHPPANIAKMATGEPLDDDDRYPWLEQVGDWLAAHRDGGVVACSALKRKYRDQLRAHCPRVEFLHLSGSPELIGRRLAARSGHFMPPALLRSQYDALEPLGADEHGVVINLSEDVHHVQDVVNAFFANSAARPRT
jgi:gluconokinase